MEEPCGIVFIVDDDESVRNSLARLLRSFRLTSRGFGDAMTFLRDLPPDARGCAVVDIHMPGMTGLELQRVLAGRAVPLPVILITALDDADIRRRAIEGGAAGYFRKPFDNDALLRAVQAAMSGAAESGADLSEAPS